MWEFPEVLQCVTYTGAAAPHTLVKNGSFQARCYLWRYKQARGKVTQKLLHVCTKAFSGKRFDEVLCLNHQGERGKNISHNANNKHLLYYAFQEYKILPFSHISAEN
jgi:hypothetical protein